MERTAVNPWQWSLGFGFNQAEVVEGQRRTLLCSGQTAIDADGNPPTTKDMAAQIAAAADNLQAVLDGAGMSLANIVKLTIYTTDVDAYLQSFGILGERFAAAGIRPPATLIGVARLAFPELMVELDATAMD